MKSICKVFSDWAGCRQECIRISVIKARILMFFHKGVYHAAHQRI